MKSKDADSRLRLDLFLKRSRLVKRRSLAVALCENGYVFLNERPSLPGKSVREGDRIKIRYAKKQVVVEVTGIPETAGKDQKCYRVIEEQIIRDDLF
jgi:ribosomal 50S subunit-recycling heat shock protein